jgi:membrane protease YdiL (CAAX protease family)
MIADKLLNAGKKEWGRIFAHAFTARTDSPLRISPLQNEPENRDRLRKIPRPDLLRGLAVFILAGSVWFLMNLSFQPRFLPRVFVITPWVCLSLGINLLFGLALLLPPKTRPLAFIPFLFTLFPLSFIILAALGETLREFIPGTGTTRDLNWKFVYDCVFFFTELVFMVVFLFLSRTGNPFRIRKQAPSPPGRRVILFLKLLFILVVLFLLVTLLVRAQFPLSRFIGLLRYQIPFALLLGLKEEIFFRWILIRTGERLLASRLVTVCYIALLWSSYHGFFGEGIGSGFWSALWVCVASFWWSFLSCRYNSLWAAWTGHTVVELYGFYLMYLPFLG